MSKFQIRSDEFEAALADNLRAFEASPATSVDTSRPTIVCLGESHGSHLFAMKRKVLPGTGALLLRLPRDLGSDIVVDPGWGTIASARRLKLSLSEVGVILISHCHLDHVGDLHPLLLTISLTGGRPLLVANSTSVNGGPSQPSVLPDYFRGLCREVLIGESGKSIFSANSLKITPFLTSHRENRGVASQSLAYILEIKGNRESRIAFVTDGPLRDLDNSTLARLRKCTVIVVNIGTVSTNPNAPAHSKTFDNALCLHGLEGFLRNLAGKRNRIGQVAVTHLGAELLEVRSPLMKRFLAQAGHSTMLSLLDAVLRRMVSNTLGRQIRTRVLMEGDQVEV